MQLNDKRSINTEILYHLLFHQIYFEEIRKFTKIFERSLSFCSEHSPRVQLGKTLRKTADFDRFPGNHRV